MRKKPSDDVVFGAKLKYNIAEWNLNSLDLSLTEQLAVVREIYSRLGFFTEFKIDNDTFISFLWRCNYYYTRNNNPFHNFLHAITVTHGGFYFLTQVKELSDMLTSHKKLAFITSCLGHDLDHRGKNNAFEVSSGSELAIRYFDKSPLENHHAATLFKILKIQDSDIFVDVPNDKLKEIKLNIIENILATDMKVHFPMLANFKEKVASQSHLICKITMTIGTDSNILEATKMFTHCADLSGSCKERLISERWSHLVNQEFIEQVI